MEYLNEVGVYRPPIGALPSRRIVSLLQWIAHLCPPINVALLPSFSLLFFNPLRHFLPMRRCAQTIVYLDRNVPLLHIYTES